MAKLIRNAQKRSTFEQRLRASIQTKPGRYQTRGPGALGTNEPSRRQQNIRNRTIELPAEDIISSDHILITGGIGDFFVIESHMDLSRRSCVQHVTLATRAHSSIEELIRASSVFPNLKKVSIVPTDWNNTFCYVQKTEIGEDVYCGKELITAQDWSIFIIFPFIKRQVLKYQKSSHVTNKIADISYLELPKDYIACNPYSPNDRRSKRDFSPEDWEIAEAYAASFGMPLVVLNVSDDFIPESPSIINLNKKTSLPESIEIVKGASRYIGIDSCLSVIASQCFTAEKLKIKSNNGHLYNYQSIYYAPHKHFNFISESF